MGETFGESASRTARQHHGKKKQGDLRRKKTTGESRSRKSTYLVPTKLGRHKDGRRKQTLYKGTPRKKKPSRTTRTPEEPNEEKCAKKKEI